MKNELIKLNETEQFLQNANLTMTLKDIADRYGKRNDKLVKSFELQVSELSSDRFETFDFWMDTVDTQTGKGKVEKIKTYRMNLKTLVWFIAKFDANLRADIVNFAFKKLEKEKEDEVKQIKAMAEKCRIYDDGSTTISGLQDHYGFKESYDVIKKALLWKEVISITPKITIKSVHSKIFSGIVWTSHGIKSSSGKIVNGYAFLPEATRTIVEQYVRAGMPDVNDKLKLTFENAMKDYISKNL